MRETSDQKFKNLHYFSAPPRKGTVDFLGQPGAHALDSEALFPRIALRYAERGLGSTPDRTTRSPLFTPSSVGTFRRLTQPSVSGLAGDDTNRRRTALPGFHNLALGKIRDPGHKQYEELWAG